MPKISKKVEKKARSRIFVFTNYELQKTLTKLKDSKPKFYHYGHELCPTTGRPHHQGFVHYANPREWDATRRKLGFPFLEPQHGTNAENFTYTGKGTDIVQWGEPNEQGKRNDLESILGMVAAKTPAKEILEAHPVSYIRYYKNFGLPNPGELLNVQEEFRNVTVTVLIGAPGTGKTRRVYDQHGAWNVCAINQYNPEWWQPHNPWPTVLLLDEYEAGALNEDRIRSVCDGHPLQLPVKGGYISGGSVTNVYIISNSNLEWSEPMQRRISETVFM